MIRVSAHKLNNHYSFPSFIGTPKQLQLSKNYYKNYDALRNGDYLDVHDDRFAPENKMLRQKNLSFLDNLSNSEKKAFINYYSHITGFPNLKETSERIENEFVNSINKISLAFNDNDYKCIAAGYDDTCSVGKRMAFPGSDLDKAFILLKGSGNIYYDQKIVNNFSRALWENTDQRILSYNHDVSFPTIYTIAQVKHFINSINNKTSDIYFPQNHLLDLIENEYINLDKAAEYNITIAQSFDEPKLDSNLLDINKETVKNFAFFIEPLRDGKILITTPEFKDVKKYLSKFDFYNYSNTTQIKAMKNAINTGKEQKTKILKRKALSENFKNWDTNKQFEFIKTLIKYSCEDQDSFSEYFKNDRDVKSKYKHLLSMLTKNNEKYLYNPEFLIKEDVITMKLGENSYVNLYQGFIPEVLWIDTTNAKDIEQVLLHINKLQKTSLFNKIKLVQCPCPDNLIENFYRTQYKTSDFKTIYERKL